MTTRESVLRRWSAGVPCVLFAAVIACDDGDIGGMGGAGAAGSQGTTNPTTTSAGKGASSTGATPTTSTSASAAGPSTTSTTSTTSTGGGPSPGCGMPVATGQTDRTVMVDGNARSYSFKIAADYDPAVPHPLVFVFHGAGANGAQAVGTNLGIGGVTSITVGPTALGNLWNENVDLPLVDALVASLPAEMCIDTSKIFAWGYSSGGFMAHSVGCQRGDVFRGIGLVDGGGGGACTTPVGVWITHNQDDMTVPISYGTGARDQWLVTNGCQMTTTPTDPSPCVAYDGCSAGHPVVWCNPATGGHQPPGYTGQGLSLFFSSL